MVIINNNFPHNFELMILYFPDLSCAEECLSRFSWEENVFLCGCFCRTYSLWLVLSLLKSKFHCRFSCLDSYLASHTPRLLLPVSRRGPMLPGVCPLCSPASIRVSRPSSHLLPQPLFHAFYLCIPLWYFMCSFLKSSNISFEF